MRHRILVAAIAFAVGFPARVDGQPLRVEAAETYVQLYPADRFLYIKEYHLSTLEHDSATINTQMQEIARLVEHRAYCERRFGFTSFTSMEERVYLDRGFVTTECRLLSPKDRVDLLAEEAFGRVLNRPAALTVKGREIHLVLQGQDLEVRDNNSLGVYRNAEDALIVWRNGERYYEAVFGPADREASTFRSLAPFLRKDAASPEMSERDIAEWRARSQ